MESKVIYVGKGVGTLRENINDLIAHKVARLMHDKDFQYAEALQIINNALAVIINYELDDKDNEQIEKRVNRLLKKF